MTFLAGAVLDQGIRIRPPCNPTLAELSTRITELLLQNRTLDGAPFAAIQWIVHFRDAPTEKPAVLTLDAIHKEACVVTFLDGKAIAQLTKEEREGKL